MSNPESSRPPIEDPNESSAAASVAGGQLVEWIDERGAVLAVVPRSRVRRENLLHRSVAVIVHDEDGAVLVHRRADWKDVWPGRWDLAFGGIVGVGESWSEAAARELQEEIGQVGLVLRPVGTYRYTDADVAAHCQVFSVGIARSAALRFDDGEVVEVAWVAADELTRWAETHSICPDSRVGVLPLLTRRD